MKATKTLLAIMAVAVMVIAPLAVASVDAADTKVPATDAEKGYYIENVQNITDPGKCIKVADLSDMMNYLLTANNYVNESIMQPLNPLKTSVTGLDITSYKDSIYSSLKGLTDEDMESIVIEGYAKLNITTTSTGNLFLQSPEAADGDLLKEANKYFGSIPSGSTVVMKVTIKYESSNKAVSKYAEAKDQFVRLSTEEEKIICVSSSTEYTYDSKVITIENKYKEEFYQKQEYTFSNEISVNEDAPAYAKETLLPSYEVSGCSLKGKIADKDYSSDFVEKTLKAQDDLYAKSIEQKEPKDCSSSLSYDIGPADATLQERLGVATEDKAKEILTENGFTGANDASKAYSYNSDLYKSMGGKIGTGSSSGIPVWVWIVIAVAAIAVIVIVVLVLKKKGKI